MGAQAVRLTKVDIDNALSNAHLNIVYQPIMAFGTRQIWRYEAFVRWDHPGLGPLPPGAFISFFESQGRIGDLTRYVLDKSIVEAQRARLPEEIGLSLNLSVGDLHDPKLIKNITDTLRKREWPARRLTLECPLLSPDTPIERQAEIYGQLAELGCRMSLEVRGRASDAMKNLRPFPFAEIKTGGPAVLRQLRSSRGGPGLNTLSELLGFAKERDIEIVAVGVEDHEAIASLGSLGFDAGQGNVLGRAGPMPGLLHAKAEETDIMAKPAEEVTPLDLSTEENQNLVEGHARRARIAAAKRAALRRLRSAVSHTATPEDEAMETARTLQSRLETHFHADGQAMDIDDMSKRTKAAETAATIEKTHRVEDLIDELPAELRQTPVATRPHDTLADTLQAECESPADQLDKAIEELPTLPMDDSGDMASSVEASVVEEDVAEQPLFDLSEDDEAMLLQKVKRQLKITHFWPRSWRRWNRRRLARKAERVALRETKSQAAMATAQRLFQDDAKEELNFPTADQVTDSIGRERREEHAIPVVAKGEKNPLVFGPLADLR